MLEETKKYNNARKELEAVAGGNEGLRPFMGFLFSNTIYYRLIKLITTFLLNTFATFSIVERRTLSE